jgi:hypothetical protein
MPTRICVNCGKHKETKNGRVCEKGHFICAHCADVHKGIFFDHTKKKCPLCGTKLT